MKKCSSAREAASGALLNSTDPDQKHDLRGEINRLDQKEILLGQEKIALRQEKNSLREKEL
eukprot:5404993-Pleurochrysis_carterae.AAC.1